MFHYIKSSRIALLTCTVLAATGVSGQANAQTADDDVGVADIIVTAQKREQSLQDVPIAVTALSRDSLQANRITNVMDLAAQAPNLTMRPAAGGAGIPSFTLRGAVSFGSVAGQDKSIPLYIDGVYIGSAQGSAFELPDLERIEVLRGPQGTLFGRNATAGAISIITREPSGEFGLRQQFTYGNYDHLRSSTRVELPQMGPLSASISYTHSEREGEIKNLGAGVRWDRSGATKSKWARRLNVSPKTLGDDNVESVFAAVKLEPSDSFKTVYRFDWMENHFTPDGNSIVTFNPSGAGAAFGAILTQALLENPSPIANEHRPKAVNNSFTVPGYQTVMGHNLTSTLVLSDTVTLKNIAAYRKSFIFSGADIGGLGSLRVTPTVATMLPTIGIPLATAQTMIGAPIVGAGSQTESRARQWSDELQINYDSDFLTVTAGAIYYKVKTITGAPDGLGGSSILAILPGFKLPSGRRQLSFNTGKSMAAYLQAEVHVTPQLDVIGGARITRDRKTGTTFVYVANPGRQDSYTFSYKDTRPSYMFGVNFKPNDDILLYGKYSTGFVSGGAVSGIEYPAETVKAWEAGIKADLFDRRLRANLALFKADYTDIQAVSGGQFITPPRPELGTLVLREGDLDTKGFEAELTFVPVRGLTLNAGAGYTDLKFTNPNPLLRAPGAPVTARPKWTSNLSAQYVTDPLFGDATMMFRVDATYRSRIRTLAQLNLPASFNPIIYSEEMWQVNSRIAIRDIDFGGGKAELAVWGKNLNDADNPAFPIYFGYEGSSSYVRARTYGVDLTFDF
ncbi:MAG TPA: TonB-dependent receptor [Novosphingobium sp.]|nr:TonB-dependent receptor [Novosphingobium sp.]